MAIAVTVLVAFCLGYLAHGRVVTWLAHRGSADLDPPRP